MNAARKIALWTGLVAWVYSYAYFRGLSDQAIDELPGAATIFMGIVSTVLIATSVAAGLRIFLWPALAIASALLMVAFVVIGQQAVLNQALESVGSAQRAGLGDALDAVLRSRSAGGVIIVTLVPLLLLLSGLTALLVPRASTERLADA